MQQPQGPLCLLGAPVSAEGACPALTWESLLWLVTWGLGILLLGTELSYCAQRPVGCLVLGDSMYGQEAGSRLGGPGQRSPPWLPVGVAGKLKPVGSWASPDTP